MTRHVLGSEDYDIKVAVSERRSSNILCKICEMIQSTSIEIVVFAKGSKSNTVANIFYEAGIAHMLGKEVILVGLNVRRPSDLAGVEWIHLKKPSDLGDPLRECLGLMTRKAEFYTILGENEMEAYNLEKASEYFMKAILLANDIHAKDCLSTLIPKLEKERALRKQYDRARAFYRFVTRT